MKKNRASWTAKGIAVIRAMESMKPEKERLFYDPFAAMFAGRFLMAVGRFFIGSAKKKGPGVQEYITCRVRYIDDCLKAAIAEGIHQVVILGAGYDSRAYRFAPLMSGIKVFEVDYPASLANKLKKLREYFGAVPEHVTYVPLDFDREDLRHKLPENGYDQTLKTFFIWEGVTYYLSADAVDATLKFVKEHSGEGSSIIFDYTYAGVIHGNCSRGEIVRMKRYRWFTGESLVFGLEEGKDKAFLESRGFCRIIITTSEKLKTLYYPQKDVEIAPIYRIAQAHD